MDMSILVIAGLSAACGGLAGWILLTLVQHNRQESEKARREWERVQKCFGRVGLDDKITYV